MKKWVKKGVLAAALILCAACRTQQAGAAFETRDGSSALGGFIANDFGGHVETSLVYMHNMSPEISGITMQSAGCDFILKYPVYFAGNRLSVFPMAGVEGRYILSVTDIVEKSFSEGNIIESAGKMLEADWSGGSFGLGVKFGAGMDVSFTDSLFLRAAFLYQPEAVTFMDGSPGLRFRVGFGSRTKNNPQRVELAQARAARQAELEEESRERNLLRAAEIRFNDPRVFYELALYYRKEGKNVHAAAAMEKALRLDPDFRHIQDSESYFTRESAAILGIETQDNFAFGNDYSLNYLLGCTYFDAANLTGADRDRVVDAADSQRTNEKALAAFRKGYDIDIKGGENNDRNLKAVYLGLIGKTLDLLDREDEAAETYFELSRIVIVTGSAAIRAAAYR